MNARSALNLVKCKCRCKIQNAEVIERVLAAFGHLAVDRQEAIMEYWSEP